MNLLVDKVFSVDASSPLTLPEVLSKLSDGISIEFTALRTHQQHAWFAFLTQVASLAFVRTDRKPGYCSEAQWQKMLLSMTDGSDEPWALFVSNLEKPAFMQPPVPESSIETWNRFQMPDEIDVLVTTKNHDLKRAKIVNPRPEHWVYALVMRQTMQGVYGRGHYGIARMNSGLGSRPLFTLAPSERWSDRFLRDVYNWLDQRDRIKGQYNTKNGIGLLWTVPWDGSTSLELKDLDPFFVEVCARIRLVGIKDARGTTSKTWRTASKEAKGNTGDIWTPVNSETNAALSVTSKGFVYDSLQGIWFSADWIRPPAMLPRSGDSILIAQVLARGQGKTEGFHRRVVPIVIGDQAEERCDAAQNFKLRVVKPTVLNLLQGGPDSLRFDDDRVNRWLDRFRDEVDLVFFQMPEDWDVTLFKIGRDLFDEAIDAVAPIGPRRARAIVWAERSFYGSIKHHFPKIRFARPDYYKDESTARRHSRIAKIAASLWHRTSPKDLAMLCRLQQWDRGEFRLLMERFVQSPESIDTPWVVAIRSMAKLVGLHRPGTSIGKTLAILRLDELRVLTLLAATGSEFHTRIDSMVRQFVIRGAPVDQTELVDLVLSDGQQEWSERVRRKIARDFYGGQ